MTNQRRPPASPEGFTIKLYTKSTKANLAIASFVGGFLFDILTTGDRSWFLIGQQDTIWLWSRRPTADALRGRQAAAASGSMSVVKRWYYEFRRFIVHSCWDP